MHVPPDESLADVLKEVRRIEWQSRRLVKAVLAGGYASVFRGAGLEFHAVREYADGDDERAVDWNVTARMGRPFVKTFVDERDLTVLFVLDRSASMDAGLGRMSPRQAAARVAACLGLAAAGAGDRVGLVAAGSGARAFVPPRRGRAHALRVVRDCLALPAQPGAADLGAALRFATRALRRHAILFVLSDFLDAGWESALARAARRHEVVAVRLLPAERDLPRVGLVRVGDPETGVRRVVDLSNSRVRAAYAARVRAWSEGVERALGRARVDRLDVPVPRAAGRDAVVGPILDFFRMREARGTKR